MAIERLVPESVEAERSARKQATEARALAAVGKGANAINTAKAADPILAAILDELEDRLPGFAAQIIARINAGGV